MPDHKQNKEKPTSKVGFVHNSQFDNKFKAWDFNFETIVN